MISYSWIHAICYFADACWNSLAEAKVFSQHFLTSEAGLSCMTFTEIMTTAGALPFLNLRSVLSLARLFPRGAASLLPEFSSN